MKNSAMSPQQDEILRPDEVCAMLGGISRKTLCGWNNTHKHRKILAPMRISHRVVLYNRSRVEAFMEKCRSV